MSVSNKLEAEATAINAFAAWTDRTAQYPVTAEPYYLVLGIVDEWGEMLMAPDPENCVKELGDVMWYVCRYARNVLKVDPGKLWTRALDVHDLTQTIWSFPQAAGVLCGVEKKRVRDGAKWDDATKAEKNRAATGAVCSAMFLISLVLRRRDINSTVVDVLQTTMNKLEDRKARDLIRGDGDNR